MLQAKLNEQARKVDKMEISPFPLGRETIECDRMIPLRSNIESQSADDIFEIKQEIESAPPEFLNEDKRLEQPQQNNNNMQDQNNQVSSYAQELASGENLKKYNILLQNS